MNPLLEIISRETSAVGGVSFARFMEIALYCPVYGFYEKEADKIGKRGDFFTSVSIGAVFGQLLAFQFAEWFDSMSPDDEAVSLIEAGAHTGQLAKDILTCLRAERSELYERITYWIVEPSAQGKLWQESRLAGFSGKVRWVSSVPQISEQGVTGIIFSNELLDAMPVHRFGWDAKAKQWFEWGVSVEGDRLVWFRAPPGALSDTTPPETPGELREMLPDGFSAESCPAAEAWWKDAATSLRRGRLLTFDYGLTEEEMFLAHRPDGTLRAYSAHRAGKDLLADPGDQDLTADVNFTAIRRMGEACGLRTELMVSQERFLVRIVEQMGKESRGTRIWTSKETRQFQTLTHPQHLGRSFKVLVQSR